MDQPLVSIELLVCELLLWLHAGGHVDDGSGSPIDSGNSSQLI